MMDKLFVASYNLKDDIHSHARSEHTWNQLLGKNTSSPDISVATLYEHKLV